LSSRPTRVLVAKPGLDGHDRGAKVIAHALRDAGMEVIYTGLHQTAPMIASSAVQEDVDVVCISILSGAHMQVFQDLFDSLKKLGASDIPVLGGGIIPEGDTAKLKAMGALEVFTSGSSLKEIVDYIQALMAKPKK